MGRKLARGAALAVILSLAATFLFEATPPSHPPMAAEEPSPSPSPSPRGYGGKSSGTRLVNTPFIRPSFEFGDEVSAVERDFVRTAVREANGLFRIPHQPDPPDSVTVYAFSNRATLLDRYAIRAGVTRRAAERAWQGISGRAIGGWFMIDLSSLDGDQGSRYQTMYHEWFHLIDNHLTFRDEPAYWLVEGMAEWAAWKAAAHHSRASFEAVRGRMRADAAHTEVPLRSMKGRSGFRNGPSLSGAYATAFWAVEHLDTTVPELVEFLKRSGDRGYFRQWEAIFRSHFGVSVERFYRSFERFRARGFRD